MTSRLSKDHIAKTAWSCWFALHDIRKIRPFITQHAAQLLVQALVISRLDYCNALLAGLPSCTIKPLQMIQNAAARLVFSEPKSAHVTPLFISLHWLPVAARIKFKTLMFAYRTATGPAPTASTSPQEVWDLWGCDASSQRGKKSLSRTFSFTVPGWWIELPAPIRNAEYLIIVKRHLKSLPSSLDFILKKKKTSLSFLNFALFPLTSHCLARICSEQCLEIWITSTSCICLPPL